MHRVYVFKCCAKVAQSVTSFWDMIGMAQDIIAFMEYHMLVGGHVEIHLKVRLSFTRVVRSPVVQLLFLSLALEGRELNECNVLPDARLSSIIQSINSKCRRTT